MLLASYRTLLVMTKITLLKKREWGLLVGLLGCLLQTATICIPAYAFLGRLFWLATYVAHEGELSLLHLVLLVPALVHQLKSGVGV